MWKFYWVFFLAISLFLNLSAYSNISKRTLQLCRLFQMELNGKEQSSESWNYMIHETMPFFRSSPNMCHCTLMFVKCTFTLCSILLAFLKLNRILSPSLSLSDHFVWSSASSFVQMRSAHLNNLNFCARRFRRRWNIYWTRCNNNNTNKFNR